MRRRMPPLNNLRAFEAAARHQSFTRAADELFVTQGAVSRHVRALEEYLGFELFDRGPHGLQLSSEGRKYADELTRALNHISHASESLLKSKRRVTISVYSYVNLIARWLLPRLPRFYAEHPGIQIRLTAARFDSALANDVRSLSIRFGAGEWHGLHSEHLFDDRQTPFCTPAVAAELDLADPKSLLGQRIFFNYERQEDWSDWFMIAAGTPFEPQLREIAEDPAIGYQCVLAGMGVGMGNAAYIEDDVRSGRLVTPFQQVLQGRYTYHAVMHPSALDTPELRLFCDWLVRMGQETARWDPCSSAVSKGLRLVGSSAPPGAERQ